MSFTIQTNGRAYELRSKGDFETMRSYLDSEVLPIMQILPEISTTRCSMSGVPVAFSTLNEIQDCIATGIRNAKLTRFDDLLGPVLTDSMMKDEIESLIDEISIRMILSWRKSPSLTFRKDRSVEAAVNPQKQLCILLNMFLFFEADLSRAVEDEVGNRRRIAAMADHIALHWDESPIYQDLLHALIELDAKYRIVEMKLNKKEREAIDALNFDSIDPKAILDIVNRILAWRSEYKPEIYVGSHSWTQDTYRELNLRMAAHAKYSNLVPQEKKPKTPEEKQKTHMKNVRSGILKSIFGNL